MSDEWTKTKPTEPGVYATQAVNEVEVGRWDAKMLERAWRGIVWWKRIPDPGKPPAGQPEPGVYELAGGTVVKVHDRANGYCLELSRHRPLEHFDFTGARRLVPEDR